jgi:putative sterol carrier protein
VVREDLELVADTQWEYIYYWIEATEKTDHTRLDLSGIGGVTYHNYYSYERKERPQVEESLFAVYDELANFGRDGWELVAAVPKWSWAVVSNPEFQKAFAYAFPSHVVGWYCIFKRPRRRIFREVTPDSKGGDAKAAAPKGEDRSQLPNSIEEYMTGLPQAFKPGEAKGVDAVLQFRFTGDDPGNWVIKVASGRCEVTRGINRRPTVTITCPSQVWLRIVRWELDVAKAFTEKMFEVQGDVPTLLAMGGWFGVEQPR